MNNFKILIILNLILFLTSCGTVKEGFVNQKKTSSDEFLVEKKSPLVMPPNFDELPEPKVSNTEINSEKNRIKKLISSSEEKNMPPNEPEDIKTSFEESVLKKIKKN